MCHLAFVPNIPSSGVALLQFPSIEEDRQQTRVISGYYLQVYMCCGLIENVEDKAGRLC